MKSPLALAFVVATVPALAQTTGISRPPDAPVDDIPMTAPARPKPSAAVPQYSVTDNTPSPMFTAPPHPQDSEYRPYRPYGTVATTGTAVGTAADTDAIISSVTLHTRDQETTDDSGVVTEVVRHPNELPIGTALRARLRTTVDTKTTLRNTPFSALLAEDVRDNDRVVLPVGSIVEGIVTRVRGGKRIHGEALIHLQAQRVVLPDGTSIPLQAQVIDTDLVTQTTIDNEGNILHRDHPGTTAAIMTGLTGGGAIAGALVGGGVGALVGAGIGAGIGTAVWLKQDREAHLPQDTLLVFSLTDPMAMRQAATFSLVPETAAPIQAAQQQPVPQPYTPPQQAFVPTN